MLGTSLLWGSTVAFTYLKLKSAKCLCLIPVVLVLVLYAAVLVLALVLLFWSWSYEFSLVYVTGARQCDVSRCVIAFCVVCDRNRPRAGTSRRVHHVRHGRKRQTSRRIVSIRF